MNGCQLILVFVFRFSFLPILRIILCRHLPVVSAHNNIIIKHILYHPFLWLLLIYTTCISNWFKFPHKRSKIYILHETANYNMTEVHFQTKTSIEQLYTLTQVLLPTSFYQHINPFLPTVVSLQELSNNQILNIDQNNFSLLLPLSTSLHFYFVEELFVIITSS